MSNSNIRQIVLSDGTQWPVVKDSTESRLDSIQWRLIHAPKEIEDWEFKEVASVLSAYRSLTEGSTGAKKLPMIRRAIKKSV